MASNSAPAEINLSADAHSSLLQQFPSASATSRGKHEIKGKGKVECFFLSQAGRPSRHRLVSSPLERTTSPFSPFRSSPPLSRPQRRNISSYSRSTPRPDFPFSLFPFSHASGSCRNRARRRSRSASTRPPRASSTPRRRGGTPAPTASPGPPSPPPAACRPPPATAAPGSRPSAGTAPLPRSRRCRPPPARGIRCGRWRSPSRSWWRWSSGSRG